MPFTVYNLDEVNHGYDTSFPPNMDAKARRPFEQFDKNTLGQIDIRLRDSAQILRLRWRTPALAYREYRRELAKIARHIDALNQRRRATFYPPAEPLAHAESAPAEPLPAELAHAPERAANGHYASRSEQSNDAR